MSNILTVQANLDGNANGLVAAGKAGAKAISGVEAAANAANRAASRMESALANVGRGLQGGIRGLGQFGSAVGRIGAQAIGVFTRLAAGVVTAGAAIGTALGGAAIKSGLDRLMSIQDATVALTRMLGGVEQAAALTDKVLKVVQGTPFAFPQFAEATRQLVAFGVKAEKIPSVLQAIADSAAASGEGAEAVDRITQAFANMAVTGKLNADIIQSLGSAGVNALGILANHFGVTTGEAQAMISEGLIPADQAMDILVKGIEEGSHGIAGDFNSLAGAAQDLGKTISGSLGNVKAAFARMGAAWLKPFEQDFPRVLNDGVIPLLDKLGEYGKKVTQKFADTGALDKFTDWLIKVTDNVGPFLDGLGRMTALLNPLKGVWDALMKVLPGAGSQFQGIGRELATTLVPAFADLAESLVPLVPAIADLAGAMSRGLVGAMGGFAGILRMATPLIAAFFDIINRLPTPLLGVATGLLMLNRAGVPVKEMLVGLVSGVQGFLTQIGQGEGKIGGFFDGITKAGGKFSGFTGALQGVSSFLGGPWGLALGGAVTALSLLMTAQDNAAANVDELTGSLDRQTGAFTEATRASVIKALQDAGALDAANKMGINLKDVTEAALGNEDAMARVSAAVDKYNEANGKMGTSGSTGQMFRMQTEEALKLTGALTGQVEAVNTARNVMSNYLAAQGAVGQATAGLRDATASATQAIADNQAITGEATLTGAAAQEQINKVSDAARAMQETMVNSGLATDLMRRAQWDSIPALMETYQKLGMNEQAAADLTAEVLGMPASKVIDIYTTAAQAIPMVDTLKDRIESLRDRTINIDVQYTGARDLNGDASGSGRFGFANGGIAQASGGGFKAFANGGMNGMGQSVARVPQIVNGGANILWGEPETGWEGYVSGKKSMIQRSKRVWAQIGDKLGMFDGMGGGGSPMVGQLNVQAAPGMTAAELAAKVMDEMAWRFS